MSRCSRCETLPTGSPEEGVLYIAPPLAHTRGTLRRLLLKSGLDFEDPLDDVVSVQVTPDSLRSLGDLFFGELSGPEMRDSRALLVERGVTPGLRELSRMRDLGSLVAEVRGEWLMAIMRDERLTVHFQPIVSAADPGVVFAYECLLRGVGEDGAPVGPGPMFEAARNAGLLFNLDRAARMKAIEEATRYGISETVFINFNPTSIYDPVYCLRSTMNAIEQSPFRPEDIVFEVVESDTVQDDAQLVKILNFYREAGFRVALDDLGAGYGSLARLARLRPDFVKLDIALVQGVDKDPYRAIIAAKLLELARDLGVRVIAEGVETEAQYHWLLAHGADYLQGYYFARPGSPPPLPSPAYAERAGSNF